MTVTNVEKDQQAATMTITAEFDAPADQVWQLWQDPRLLERWWGPPTHPATVVDHELTACGTVTYFMTGPEGDRYHGLWRVLEVEPARHLEFEDAFADSDGTADTSLPTTRTQVSIEGRPGGGTTMIVRAAFPSPEAMEQLMTMGMDEGITLAMGQMDALLAPVR